MQGEPHIFENPFFKRRSQLEILHDVLVPSDDGNNHIQSIRATDQSTEISARRSTNDVTICKCTVPSVHCSADTRHDSTSETCSDTATHVCTGECCNPAHNTSGHNRLTPATYGYTSYPPSPVNLCARRSHSNSETALHKQDGCALASGVAAWSDAVLGRWASGCARRDKAL